MSVLIPDMDMPEKCCKCPILYKHIGVCSLKRRRVSDPGTKPDWCPLKEVEES